MTVREISPEEIPALEPLISALDAHHNQVSLHHRGHYPGRPHSITLAAFRDSVTAGISRIAVTENDGEITGFCKIDLTPPSGKLDFLTVLPEYRKMGLGSALMDWAMDTFRNHGVSKIEVKVIAGNDAIHLYEKYGFKLNAHLLWHCED